MLSQPTQTKNATLIRALRAQLRGEVLARDIDRAMYSTDASSYKIMPSFVVTPLDADDVATAVRVIGEHSGSVVPRGGGTSLSGQTIGPGVVLDLSKYMNGITTINADKRWVEVQAGIALGSLNRALAPHGLKVGPDPSSGNMATIGGMTGNNSTGAHSILYGMMSDHVREVDVVLSDGSQVRFAPKTAQEVAAIIAQDTLEAEIYRSIPALIDEYADDIATRYPKTWRNVAGYNLHRMQQLMQSGSSLNLAPLIVGSEGTLGVITSVKLGVVDLPKHVALAVVHFDSLRKSMEAVPFILEHKPAAVELIDNYFLDLSRKSPEWGALLPHYFRDDPTAVLVTEFYDDTESELKQRASAMQDDLIAKGFDGEILHLSDPDEITTLWNIRKAGAGLLMSERSDAKPLNFVDDATVPIEHLPDFVDEIVTICEAHDARPAMIGHASAGCVHISPTLNTKTPEGIAKLQAISEGILQTAIKYDGSTTGEHGEGIARSHFNEQLYGERLHTAFRQVKGIFDPHNIMNPGKIIDAPEPWDPSVIRLSPTYNASLVPNTTWLDFSADGGFAGAVEMCNGQGFCRNADTGIMCPSYKVTRDEQHSTRGRANALRLAISGELGSDGLNNDELYEVMDLCIECKACQRECPSIVDMAKMKSEFLAHYQQANGVPLRSRVFANIHSINRISAVPIIRQLTNWSFDNLLFRQGLERVLGISAQRPLPKLTTDSFSRWFRSRGHSNNANKGPVVLWDDTFLTYNEPDIGKAAVRLLEAAGYTVELLHNHACCGRPMISKGLLAQAQDVARRNLEQLRPYIQQGVPVVGLEPSCVSAFRDEYPSLLRSDEAKQLAENTYFFDEFFSTLVNDIAFAAPAAHRTIHVHGHCHEHSLIGSDTLMQTLQALPNTTVHLIDSGCCGMAGSFGYEREHVEVSLKIGEDRLFPAVRAAAPDATIVAPGTSCRHQIADGTGRTAVHPVVLMAEYLA